MEFSDVYWVVFGVAFVVGELFLLGNEGPNGMLTAKLKQILGIDPSRWWRFLGIPILATFCVWLFGHLVFGW